MYTILSLSVGTWELRGGQTCTIHASLSQIFCEDDLLSLPRSQVRDRAALTPDSNSVSRARGCGMRPMTAIRCLGRGGVRGDACVSIMTDDFQND